jgi:hypothetical protein
MPVPENATEEFGHVPATKFVPLTVTFCVTPCSNDDGETDVAVSAAFTVKPPLVPTPESGFVIVTVRAPVVAPLATETGTVSCDELTNDVEPTVRPVPEKVTTAPLTKLEPLIVIVWVEAPWPSAGGLIVVNAGAASTVNALFVVTVPVSVFVIVTLRRPVVALLATVTFAVIVFEVTFVTAAVTFEPENVTVAPDWKLEPVIVTGTEVAPWPRAFGVMVENVGGTIGALPTAKSPKLPVAMPVNCVVVDVRVPAVVEFHALDA